MEKRVGRQRVLLGKDQKDQNVNSFVLRVLLKVGMSNVSGTPGWNGFRFGVGNQQTRLQWNIFACRMMQSCNQQGLISSTIKVQSQSYSSGESMFWMSEPLIRSRTTQPSLPNPTKL